MTVWLRDAEDALLQTLADARSVFCFLDYDGTLAPLASTPDAALPPPGTAALLAALVAAPGTAVAVVSGRTIAAVRRFVDVRGIYYIGVHGLEVRLPNGAVHTQADITAVRPVLPAIQRHVEATLGSPPGVRVEDKGAALAFHYRLASTAAATAVRETVEHIVGEYRRAGVPLTVLYGHQVVEIYPEGMNKGKAVRELLAAHAPDALPLYIGDDRTDEDAFEVLPPPALTIRVGSADEPTLARYRVSTPDDVHCFLGAVLNVREHRLSERKSAGSPA